jgi:transcriptional regulator with XRE-family HTH domain
MEWLKAIRRKKEYTQNELAMLAGIAQESYSNIENGKRRPSVEVAKKIADALDFDWTLFFEDSKETA